MRKIQHCTILKVDKYDAYKGSLDQLSKPDRFAYEVNIE